MAKLIQSLFKPYSARRREHEPNWLILLSRVWVMIAITYVVALITIVHHLVSISGFSQIILLVKLVVPQLIVFVSIARIVVFWRQKRVHALDSKRLHRLSPTEVFWLFVLLLVVGWLLVAGL